MIDFYFMPILNYFFIKDEFILFFVVIKLSENGMLLLLIRIILF